MNISNHIGLLELAKYRKHNHNTPMILILYGRIKEYSISIKVNHICYKTTIVIISPEAPPDDKLWIVGNLDKHIFMNGLLFQVKQKT